MEVATRRPQRWDAPFGEPLRDAEIDRLLAAEPFCGINPAVFPATLPLREILRNDARLERYADGDIVVREGDYGHSAFLVLSGRVRVVLSGLSPEALGRQEPERLGWLATLMRVVGRPRLPEVREGAHCREGEAPAEPGSVYQGTARREPRPSGFDLRGQGNSTRVFLQDVPRVLDETHTAVLEAGEIFGELAALTRTARTATVFAEGEAVLLEIRWQGLRDLMRRTDALRRHIERLYRENSLRVHLRETPLLAALPAERLEAVAAATVFETYGEFDWHDEFESAVRRRPGDAIVDEPLIAEEGTPADGLILVRSGFTRLSRRYGHGHRTTAYLGRGQVFGLAEAIQAAASGERVEWTQSLRALGYVDMLKIRQAVLEEHVFPHVRESRVESRELNAGLKAPASASASGSRLSTLDSRLPDQSLLEFLVDRRLINGREAMVIDLDRCTRCDDCVRACAATHDNNPRFVRQGHRHGPLLVAQACMHCVDPVCMIGCPTGAIHRDPSTGVVRINDPTCIGCSTCAQSCPYDNIQMVEIRDRRGRPLIDAATQQPIAKATKCDLCTDLAGGPACQRACPHDALVRLDLGNLGSVTQWVSR